MLLLLNSVEPRSVCLKETALIFLRSYRHLAKARSPPQHLQKSAAKAAEFSGIVDGESGSGQADRGADWRRKRKGGQAGSEDGAPQKEGR